MSLLRFPVVLSRPLANDVHFEAVASTPGAMPNPATPDVDYRPRSVTGVIPVGQTTTTFDVEIIGDVAVEQDETFEARLVRVDGALIGFMNAQGKIFDDDHASAFLPHLRPDRFVTTENADVFALDPLANDRIPLQLTGMLNGHPMGLDLIGYSELDQGALPSGNDDRWFVQVENDAVGEGRFAYSICDGERRCAESEVELVVRPVDETLLRIDATADAGFHDAEVSHLRPLSTARFDVTALVPAATATVDIGLDPTPDTPWDAHNAGTAWWIDPVGGPVVTPSRWRALSDASSANAEDVDLYMGVDENCNGRPDATELRCVSAMAPRVESCEVDITLAAAAPSAAWTLVHNRSAANVSVNVQRAVVDIASQDQRVTVTGPGHAARGDVLPLRVSWDDPSLLPGDRRVAYLRVEYPGVSTPGLSPIRIHRSGAADAPRPLRSGLAVELALEVGGSHEGTFIDVPIGATRLSLEATAAGPVDLAVARRDFGVGGRLPLAPPREQALRVARGSGNATSLVVDGASLQPGRWYVTPINAAGTPINVRLTATIDSASAPPVASGTYFNPHRSGHGMFLYPAGEQLVLIWYTYREDGSPTWYYLQADRPDATGLWHAPLYRSSWNGSRNLLEQVGTGRVSPMGGDAFQFTWTLDGVAGSEPMQMLGRGCPRLNGAAVGASSHWFDPAKAGTGYSVMMLQDYEMHIAFVYDALGMPSFLIAERGSFGGAQADIPLVQLQGFCPTCPRAGAPLRRPVGMLARTLRPGGLDVDIDAIYAAPVPGYWTTRDRAILLGGAGSTQKCP